MTIALRVVMGNSILSEEKDLVAVLYTAKNVTSHEAKHVAEAVKEIACEKMKIM